MGKKKLSTLGWLKVIYLVVGIALLWYFSSTDNVPRNEDGYIDYGGNDEHPGR